MKRLGLALALCAFLCGSVQAQLAGGLMFPGPGTHASSTSYTGPGDIVSGSTGWGSCARAYNAAYANGTNSMCDLKDKTTGTVAICTLRVATTGFVDLTAYCGGNTPSVACGLAAGGSCVISQVYDQTGNSNHLVQGTAANMPGITFSSVNGLPVINCGTGGTSLFVATAGGFGTPPNWSFSVVYERTSGTAVGGAVGVTNTWIGAGSGANLAAINNSSSVTEAATDSAWHGLNSGLTNANGSLNVDGSDNTGLAIGSSGVSSGAMRFCRAGAVQLGGNVAEGGFWPANTTPTQRGNLYTNMHGANGYNGAF